MCFICSETNLVDCVESDKRTEYQQKQYEIFEMPNSQGVQHSRLKVEGIFRGGLFRSMKSYYLVPLLESHLCEQCGREGGQCDHPSSSQPVSKPVVRAKGLTRNVQNVMVEDNFRVSEERQPYFATYSLRPTPAQEMTIGIYTKKNSSCINFKRKVGQVSSV